MSETLRARLRADLTTSMKARDKHATAAIRAALGAIDNAEAVDASAASVGGSEVIAGAVTGVGASDVARRVLTDADVVALIRHEITTRTAAADEYDALGGRAAEAAVTLRAEADALRVYVDE